MKINKFTNKQINELPLIRKHQQNDLNSSNLAPDLSPNTILALHQQYLMNRNNYLNNARNLDEASSSGYHAFGNVDNFYRY